MPAGLHGIQQNNKGGLYSGKRKGHPPLEPLSPPPPPFSAAGDNSDKSQLFTTSEEQAELMALISQDSGIDFKQVCSFIYLIARL